MAVPTRDERLAHAAVHFDLWNEGQKQRWLDSWSTIASGALYMYDPVGTELKHHASAVEYMAYTFDLFQEHLNMQCLVVHANGDEMAWVNENRFADLPVMYSIETFRWDPDGTLHIKTYYDMPESVGEDDDPYEYTLGRHG